MEESNKDTDLSGNKVDIKSLLQTVIRNSDTNSNTLDDITKNLDTCLESIKTRNITLSESALITLPTSLIETISNVVYLNLSHNKLNDLPSSLSLLKQLHHLDISSNEFCKIPAVITELRSLRSVIANRNSLEEIPNDFGNLENLISLDLSWNMLRNIPSMCSKLKYLQKLSLTGNRFKRIPFCISIGMTSLKEFDFSHNKRAELNISPKSTNISSFYARNNDICPSFPSWIFCSRYFYLEIVELDNTQFNKIELVDPDSKSRLRKLSIKQSNLSNEIMNRIIPRITELENLDIGNAQKLMSRVVGNCFWSLPLPQLENSLKIKEIKAPFTGIPYIPTTISNYKNLKSIDISGNYISWLPNEICSLENLEILKINNNDLSVLPENFGNIVSLKEINMSFNKLTHLPNSMISMKNLQYLDLYDNELSTFPEALVELSFQGLDLEKNYFASTSSIIRNIDYESMVERLREYWPNNYKNGDGPKEVVSDSDFSFSTRYSSSDSVEENESGTMSETERAIEEECWNNSEDSTDEFDPHGTGDLKQVCGPCLPDSYKLQHKIFCPADTHATQVKIRVSQMLKNGTLVWTNSHEEGQFEDA